MRTSDYLETGIPFEKRRTALSFTLSADSAPADHILILPLSWYAGYSLSGPAGAEISPSSRALVQIYCPGEGTYRVYYGGTPVQKLSALLSFFTMALLVIIRHAGHSGSSFLIPVSIIPSEVSAEQKTAGNAAEKTLDDPQEG